MSSTSEVIAASKVIDWIADQARQVAPDTKAATLLTLRLRLLQPDLAQIAYALARNESPVAAIDGMIEREADASQEPGKSGPAKCWTTKRVLTTTHNLERTAHHV